MNRYVSALLGYTVMSLLSTPLWANGPVRNACQAEWDEICAGYHKNHLWPWPDICPDRRHARMPFDLMVQNGWRRQNLLGSHHFKVDTNQLTTSGELKVRWVMTQAPEQYRQVFVERSLNREVTSQRIASAEQYAAQVAMDGQAPIVQDTHLIAEGRPAAVVDYINVQFQESMPPPVLKDIGYGED